MADTRLDCNRRELTEARDREFLEMYQPTLDKMMAQKVPHPRMAAVLFTIANGHPHYHVEMENAYRRVCHLLGAEEKNRDNARDYDPESELGLANDRLRRQMWVEITDRVRTLLGCGMSVESALEHVLTHCRATRFYLSPATALTKICPKARARALR